MNYKIILALPTIFITIGVYQFKAAVLELDITNASSKATIAKVVTKPTPAPATLQVAPTQPTAVYKKRSTKTVEQWRPLVSKYFPANQVENALQVMACESGGNPTIIGDKTLTYWQDGTLYGYSVGLMQVRRLPGRPSEEWLKNPEQNIQWSSNLWRARSWSPSWSCATLLGIR